VAARNLTLTVDEDVLREARKIALDRNTSVNAMIREYLAGLVERRSEATPMLTDEQKTALEELKEMFLTTRYELGPITWTRDDLHERR
jgi:hypothetical protein